jgi:hypothetical protein
MAPITNSKPGFLIANDPKQNLELLANFDPATSTGSFCTTEEVFKNTPKWNPSKETIREWTTHAAAAWILSSLVLFPVGGMVNCMLTTLQHTHAPNLDSAVKCLQMTVKGYEDGRVKMISLLSAAILGLSSIGWYAFFRTYFHDSKQAARFAALNKEYSQAAALLQSEYQQALDNPQKEALRSIKDTALKLKANQLMIRMQLETFVRLTKPQAKLLAHRLQASADQVLIPLTSTH